MTTTNDDGATGIETRPDDRSGHLADDLKAKLMRPLTVTAPTWAFVAAGVALLALVMAAID